MGRIVEFGNVLNEERVQGLERSHSAASTQLDSMLLVCTHTAITSTSVRQKLGEKFNTLGINSDISEMLNFELSEMEETELVFPFQRH